MSDDLFYFFIATCLCLALAFVMIFSSNKVISKIDNIKQEIIELKQVIQKEFELNRHINILKSNCGEYYDDSSS